MRASLAPQVIPRVRAHGDRVAAAGPLLLADLIDKSDKISDDKISDDCMVKSDVVISEVQAAALVRGWLTLTSRMHGCGNH